MGLKGSPGIVKKGLLKNNPVVSTGMRLLKTYMMVLAMIIVFAIFTILQPRMISPSNISNILVENAYIIVLAVGMLICIVTAGNIDLSIGSVTGFIAAIAGILIINNGVNFWLALVICLLLGIAIGAWQGFWIAYMRIPAFIVTLSGMMMWRGITQWINSKEIMVSGEPLFKKLFYYGITDNIAVVFSIAALIVSLYVGLKIFNRIRKAKKGYKNQHIVWTIISCCLVTAATFALAFTFISEDITKLNRGIPAVLVTLSIVILAYSYFTSKTVYGRQIYAIGGNEKAAKLSGVNTNRMIFFGYANMGFLCAVAAFMVLGFLSQATTGLGTGYELEAIAACYIGGASAYGGRGKVSGVIIGALFMGIINKGMTMIDAGDYAQYITLVVKGAILLVAVAFDIISKRRGKTV